MKIWKEKKISPCLNLTATQSENLKVKISQVDSLRRTFEVNNSVYKSSRVPQEYGINIETWRLHET